MEVEGDGGRRKEGKGEREDVGEEEGTEGKRESKEGGRSGGSLLAEREMGVERGGRE